MTNNLNPELKPIAEHLDLSAPAQKPESTRGTKPFHSENGKLVIALTLVITVSAILGLALILLTIGIALDKVAFSEAEHEFNLILVALVALAGSALGFYFGSKP